MTDNQSVLFKKNIILIPADYDGISNQKGVLSLDFFSSKVNGTIRCFNLKPTDEVYTIGINAGDSIFKTTATAKELNNLKVEINASVNNSSKISCVIVKLNEKKYNTLLWGSTETTRAMNQSYFVENLLYKTDIISNQQFVMKNSQISAQKDDNSFEQTNINFAQKNNEKYSKNFEYKFQNNSNISNDILNDKQEEIFEDEILENYIDKVMAQTDDELKNNKTNDKNNFSNLNNDLKKDSQNAFYDKIAGQVEKMFEQNEPDKTLENLLPNSKFCKVESENGYYVFGVINQNGSPKCLCYGVPAEFYDVPPKDIEGFCQWLPTDPENYKGSGYWLTYQDAITGENVEIEIIS